MIKKEKLLLVISLLLFLLLLFLRVNNQSEKNYTCPNCNVILIVIDTLRRDHLGCYGYYRNTTPNIDKIAKEGIIFLDAISNGGHTPPSIGSILTGKYPISHGFIRWNNTLNTRCKTIAEVLKDNSYKTMAIIGNPLLIKQYNVYKGMDEFIVDQSEIKADKLTDLAIEWVRKNKDKKFFLLLWYMDPHFPYNPPESYKKIFTNREEDSNIQRIKNARQEELENLNISSEDLDYFISLYDSEIRFVDDNVGRFIDQLKKLNLTQNSIIIITADHGEFLGEYNLYFFHGGPYKNIVQIPLILKIPNQKNVKYVNGLIQHVDVMPTVLDMLNIKTELNIDGVSAFPLIKYNKKIRDFGIIEDRTIRTEKWQLINTRNRTILIDVSSDKETLKDLSDKYPEVTNKLLEILNSLNKNKSQTKLEIDETIKEKLRSLGYIV
jgi:arylsulfatase A-like enzyme